jgi:hypothetical protein
MISTVQKSLHKKRIFSTSVFHFVTATGMEEYNRFDSTGGVNLILLLSGSKQT